MTKKGIGNPVSLDTVIRDLFQNEKVKKGREDEVQKVYFSKASLSPHQKQGLIYPNGFVALDTYLIQQNDQSDVILVSFIKKSDTFIYGAYFSVNNQLPFDSKILTESKKPIPLCESATFESNDYLEVYQEVVGTTTILGLKSSLDQPYSTIQYSHHHNYYYTSLSNTGIIDSTPPRYKLLGLSKNLSKFIH
jgi:hypothetical protein